ncbi:hypothetical protein [Aeromicrobium duanguangcaii]|uniref:hypothetical protein n=1 Tax=Aeromicrobium duanguangcaii TaxID=2968086 RepID=UPI002017B6F5|nr:hypothetical protein [Aeromicrobium duanguangcaii]MCL3838499.1 hypothetical protein [Aeromicrobium duanguangcaii]
MALHSEAQRRKERDERELVEGTIWVDDLPVRARVKIAALWEVLRDSTGRGIYQNEARWSDEIARTLRLGAGRNVRYAEPEHLVNTNDFDLAMDLIGAFLLFICKDPGLMNHAKVVREQVNRILEDYRVPYRLVDDSVVPLSSDELHTSVVMPALGLLVGEEHAGANRAYVKALKEIPQDAADAITDAGTALQSVLETLGCKGNALGPLIKDARKRGLLGGHDERLTEGLLKMMDWASANRSERGDGHHTSDASRSDAWLMVHVVGALIVRLLDPSTTGQAG